MATIEFDPYLLTNQLSNQSSIRSGQRLNKWNQMLHDVSQYEIDLQLWKQHQKQGVFCAVTKFGFTGMLSRLQNQRRTNR